MPISVYCLAASDAQANIIVESLKQAGFPLEVIAGLIPNKSNARDLPTERSAKTPDGAATGGIVGGALGWMVGIGMLAIPGIGPFIAAGPIMAALCGAAIGAAVGGLTGTLIGMGMTEYEAMRYERKLRQGHILLSVHVDNSDWAERAKKIFRDCGAEDISSAAVSAAVVSQFRRAHAQSPVLHRN